MPVGSVCILVYERKYLYGRNISSGTTTLVICKTCLSGRLIYFKRFLENMRGKDSKLKFNTLAGRWWDVVVCEASKSVNLGV